jgi:Fe-S-cluster-containing hydrogenase component 2
MEITVNKFRCPQNHPCPAIWACPKDAITQKNSRSLPEIDQEKCVDCGKCIRYCPMGAIQRIAKK